jgi:TatA/E family protein of Tat protein translocase
MTLASFPPVFGIAPLAMWMPQGFEWLIIGAISLLIFGKRLPAAARGIGQSIMEFKRGMKGDGADDGQASEPAKQIAGDPAAAKPRFDAQTGKPLDQDHAATA